MHRCCEGKGAALSSVWLIVFADRGCAQQDSGSVYMLYDVRKGYPGAYLSIFEYISYDYFAASSLAA